MNVARVKSRPSQSEIDIQQPVAKSPDLRGWLLTCWRAIAIGEPTTLSICAGSIPDFFGAENDREPGWTTKIQDPVKKTFASNCISDTIQ